MVIASLSCKNTASDSAGERSAVMVSKSLPTMSALPTAQHAAACMVSVTLFLMCDLVILSHQKGMSVALKLFERAQRSIHIDEKVCIVGWCSRLQIR